MNKCSAQDVLPTAIVENGDSNPLDFDIQLVTVRKGFSGERCWVHARAGYIPAAALDQANDRPPAVSLSAGRAVLTTQPLLLSGSDVFYELHQTTSDGNAETWSALEPIDVFRRQRFDAGQPLPTGADTASALLQSGDETTVCDFVPAWHAASQRLLGIGQTVWYRDNRVFPLRPRGVAYSVYSTAAGKWDSWQLLDLPREQRFQNAGSGSAQRVDLLGGDILLPIYFRDPTADQYSSTVCRCRFDGHKLWYIEHGNELTIPVKRGLYEPSLTYFQGRFLLTLRNDEHGYVAASKDGLTFEEPRRWCFDDGSVLGNYNTQQHWVTHSDALYLVYTRRGLDNDHVFRHRAPLLIARVDPQKLHVIRDTERIVVPQRGARLGNFGVTEISPEETWVTVAEWMQPSGVEKYGSDNSIFIARLKWSKPNRRAPDQAGEQEIFEEMSAHQKIAPYFQPPLELQQNKGDYKSPLALDDGSRVATPDQWQQRRVQLQNEWHDLLGRWPPLEINPTVEVLETRRLGEIEVQRIRFAWLPNATTEGYLLLPPGVGQKPAVISVFYEPETAITEGLRYRDFAIQLAKRGIVTLSLGTTETTEAKTYSLYYPSLDQATVQPLSMLAYAAANSWHVLAQHPSVDAERIGIVGHSYGGKWAMFGACLFDKFACAAWSDPGIVFDDTRSSINYWEPWYLGYHPPPWRQRGLITLDNPARGLYPRLRAEQRDLHELHALMAPRPFLVSAGSEDPIHRWQALNNTREVYRLLGYEGRVGLTNRPDHVPNWQSNEIIYSFFEHFLK